MQRQQEINSRNDYITTLNEFIITAKSLLGETLRKLNWKENATVVKSAVKPLVTCPLDPGHRLTCDNLEKHVEMCRWHQLDYRDDDVPFPPPPANLPISSVVIDKTLQRDIILNAAQKDPSIKIGENVNDREVPQTSDRFFSDFTTDERRILYDHVVSETAGVMPQLKEFNLTMKPEGQSAPMTREQLMAAERDAKRRRVKHRSAKVHTKSKNYSEVLKEVINNQMLAYEDWIKENFGNENLQESIELDKKTIEEAKQEKQEMVWLDCDFRNNPHTRWKYILEKEKRRKERGEKDDTRSVKDCSKDVEKNYNERKRGRDESSLRRYRKDNHQANQPKYNHEASHSGGRGNESSRRESYHSKHRKDKYEEKRLRTEYKRDRYDNYYKSKYKDKNKSKNDDEYKLKYREKNDLKDDPIEKGSERKMEYCRDESNEKSTRKWDRYDGFHELDQGVRIKEEKLVDTHNQSYSHSNKSFESVPFKREEDAESTESDSASDSSQSSSSGDSRRVKKRKKSKKKHKHKHKKKHRKEHSRER